MEKPFEFIGLEEAARLLQVPFYKIRYAHKAGHVPEPPRIGTRRVYDPESLERLRAYFTSKKAVAATRDENQQPQTPDDGSKFLLRWKPTSVAFGMDVEESRRVAKAVEAIPSQCWLNCRKAILKLDDYAEAGLIEGWALSGGHMPVEHGWIVRDGVIIDPTLPDSRNVYFPGLEFRGRAGIEEFLATPQWEKREKTPFFYAFGWAGMGCPYFRKCYEDMVTYTTAKK